MTINKPYAEVIESSLNTFLAQSWEYDSFPPYGSLVTVHSILGCVSGIRTGSMDTQRYPFPYQKTEEELKAEQPQIFEFLKTTFDVTVLGYLDEHKKISYTLPPTPAKIHAFVAPADQTLTEAFFGSPDYLPLLFASQNTISHFDDLLLAIFKQLAVHKKLASTLPLFCQKFSLLTGNDYRRMKLFLQRVENLL
jgi:hypothetical protein